MAPRDASSGASPGSGSVNFDFSRSRARRKSAFGRPALASISPRNASTMSPSHRKKGDPSPSLGARRATSAAALAALSAERRAGREPSAPLASERPSLPRAVGLDAAGAPRPNLHRPHAAHCVTLSGFSSVHCEHVHLGSTPLAFDLFVDGGETSSMMMTSSLSSPSSRYSPKPESKSRRSRSRPPRSRSPPRYSSRRRMGDGDRRRPPRVSGEYLRSNPPRSWYPRELSLRGDLSVNLRLNSLYSGVVNESRGSSCLRWRSRALVC